MSTVKPLVKSLVVESIKKDLAELEDIEIDTDIEYDDDTDDEGSAYSEKYNFRTGDNVPNALTSKSSKASKPYTPSPRPGSTQENAIVID